ncbi:conserved unknown protein [Ectocarpus siliculosus]|uniref:ELMO domain-containing protein n=1 Tax=Ectocarpus siliculosus TaxID=2880 RepID=D8LB26_ECTSI|nr:conserved unknown protein [Ectocarpus siliculosus]|eukprot:CBN76535.1 conserved unknown protein [Ectocarpus siliculosus]
MSSSVLVCYVIQGDDDDPETGVQSSFRVDRPTPPRTLTLFRLREMFPFEGTFHFRLKVPDANGLSDYCWVDLTTDGDDILELAENLGGLEGGNSGGHPQQRVHLKILPIDFGGPVEHEAAENAPAEAVPAQDFYAGEGVGVAHGPGLGLDAPGARGQATADEDLASGVSGMDIGGGERFDVGDHSGSGTRVARERRGERSFDVDDDDDDDDNDGRFGAGGGGGRSPVGGGSRGEHGDGGRRGDRGRGYGDDGDDDGHDRRYRGGGGAYGDDDEDDTWKASVVNQASQGVKDFQKKTSQVAKTMGFGAKKMWNAINKGVGGPVVPSEEAMENLHELANFLGTPFSATSREHVNDLGKVWMCLFPDDEFEGAESPRWQEAGFQESNVSLDFRGTGVLALKSMVFFCQEYDRKALSLCRAQSAGGSSHYPWAVVANNLTLMLADVLEMRANQFASSRKGYWGVFDRRGAFFEIFCMAFRLLDHTWAERGAKRSNFGQIIGYTKSVIVELLESNPPNLPAFMGQAEEMGMLR